MALINCYECGTEVSTQAAACPKCGAVARPTVASARVDPGNSRKLSVPLIIGIVFMPYVFAWFLLREGYSTRARVVSFIWAALIGLQVIAGVARGPHGAAAAASANATGAKSPELVRQEADTVMAQLGETQVRKMLKDESSAQFRNSYGRIKHGERVACGEVNSRNSFGAMAGYAQWVVLYERDTAYLESALDRSAFAQKWNRYCAGDEDPVDADTDPARIALHVLRKAEHPCPKVTTATMDSDNAIHATCSNGEDYALKLNGGLYVAMRCSVSRKYNLNMC